MKPTMVIALWMLATQALGQIPPGFEVVYLQVNRPFHRDPAINNFGHVVFAAARDSFDPSTADLFYYDGQSITQLTNDNIADAMPAINDNEEIVWSKEIGPGPSVELMHLHNGVTTQLTHDDLWDEGARINNAGQIVWAQRTREGCASSIANVMLLDDSTTRIILADGFSNQTPVINEAGDIAWTRYDFCNSPWTSEILAYFNGTIMVLTNGQRIPQIPGISDDGRVAWYCSIPPPPGQDSIQLWNSGVTTTITGWGSGLRMNGQGDIAFDRWNDGNQTWQVHLFRDEHFYQVTSGDVWSFVEDINDQGELVFVNGNPPFNTRIGILRRLRSPTHLREMNCDSGGPRRAEANPIGPGG